MNAVTEPMPGTPHAERKRRIELFARATGEELRNALKDLGTIPDVALVRGPETGLVMVRGRMGGTGSLFNLGETTVTRATIRLVGGSADGIIGHGQRLGGDKQATQISAILDALGGTEDHAAKVSALADRISARLQAEDAVLSDETAATRVDFFTMVRGDD